MNCVEVEGMNSSLPVGSDAIAGSEAVLYQC
jgi:hypothetical protein